MADLGPVLGSLGWVDGQYAESESENDSKRAKHCLSIHGDLPMLT
jgi:hypothetical protein